MYVVGYLICYSVSVRIEFIRWCRMCVMLFWSIKYDKVMYTRERNEYTRPCDVEHTREK